MTPRTVLRSLAAPALATALAAALVSCTSTERASPLPERTPAPQAALTPATPAPAPTPVLAGPLLDGSGACTGPAPGTARAIEPGIGECDLVRLKGRPPTDVLVGEGRAGREVQVLYNEPGAKELYFFVNGRLDRVVKS